MVSREGRQWGGIPAWHQQLFGNLQFDCRGELHYWLFIKSLYSLDTIFFNVETSDNAPEVMPYPVESFLNVNEIVEKVTLMLQRLDMKTKLFLSPESLKSFVSKTPFFFCLFL